VVDGFSIEPEIYILAVEKFLPTLNLGGNLAYTFSIPESPVKPFLTAGYGIGNGIPIMQRLMDRSSDDLDIPVVRVGGGMKIFLSKQVALKLEYRYERYSYENSSSFAYYGYSYSYSQKVISNYHNVLFGISVFLPGAE
jgi:opacity protein-like surface antigen